MKARANRTDEATASVPELAKRNSSMPGYSRLIFSATRKPISVGKPKQAAATADLPRHRLDDLRRAVARRSRGRRPCSSRRTRPRRHPRGARQRPVRPPRGDGKARRASNCCRRPPDSAGRAAAVVTKRFAIPRIPTDCADHGARKPPCATVRRRMRATCATTD